MKTFSDLLAISQHITVEVELEAEFDHAPPWVTITVNDSVETLILDDVTRRTFSVPLLCPICVNILVHEDQHHVDMRRGVLIRDLCIEGKALIPQWCFLAQVSANLEQYAPTSHIVQHGEWRFNIDQPFYRWYHGIAGHGWLLDPEVSAH